MRIGSLVIGMMMLISCEKSLLEAFGDSCPPHSKPCASDSDCGANEVCGGGCCQQRNIMSIGFFLIPPLENPFEVLEQQVLSIDLSQGLQNDICMKDTITLNGVVKRAEGLAEGISAKLTASLKETIPGTKITFTTETISPSGNYELSMLPGTYNVFITPTTLVESLPPMVLKDVEVDEEHNTLNIVFPREDELIQVKGKVVVDREGETAGVGGISVMAFTPSFENISTSTITDPLGHFTVSMLSIEQTYTFRISGTDENPLWPTVDFPGIVISQEKTDVGELNFGEIGETIETSGLVVGIEKTSTSPLVSTLLSFEAGIGNGVFSSVVQTNDTGHFHAFLYEGLYGVSVIPPESTNFAIANFSNITVSSLSSEEELRFEVEEKKDLAGRVFQPDGITPAEEVKISALRKGELFGNNTRGTLRHTETITDRDGGYNLKLDPGRWDIIAIPPEGSQLARKTIQDFSIQSDLTTLDITLFISTKISGMIKADGCSTPVANVSIRVFGREKSTPEKAVVIGEGISDEDGKYRIQIPNPFINITSSVR